MSGIRYLIALLFLFAGLESELQASASQAKPANFSLTPSDIVTNLKSKTSVDTMTQTAPDRIHGILAERVIAMMPLPWAGLISFRHDNPLPHPSRLDAFRASGCSPPFQVFRVPHYY